MVITCIHYACPYLRYCKQITTECHYMYVLCSVPALDIVTQIDYRVDYYMYYVKCPALDIVSTE